MGALHLSSLLNTKQVYLKSPIESIEEIYTFMLKQLKKQYAIKCNTDGYLQTLIERRLDEGILFPTGVAIPHLRFDDFNDTVICVLIPNKPIETDSGIAKIFFFVITGKHGNSLYLHVLQSVIKMSKDPELFSKLLIAKTPTEFLHLLKNSDFAVKSALTVGDIMHSKIIAINKNASLKELSQLFYEHDFGYMVVVDDKGKHVGEVTVRDYMMAGLPAYTNFLSNLYFLKTLDPFEKLIKEEHDIKVESVMRQIEISITPDTSIFKAVFLMNKHKKRDIPVLQDNKLVGIISINDIFRKVIKG